MVVDDDLAILDFLQHILLDEGYEVCLASNGREALDLLATRHVDLVLLDLMMPVMNGWQFAQEWHQLPPGERPPVIVLSADRNAGAKAQALGLAAGVSKPFVLDQFLDLVATYLPPEAA
jgi:CheY-like chemotaxis protein